jgi:hypothetical protein
MTLTTQFNSRISDQLVRAGLNYKLEARREKSL